MSIEKEDKPYCGIYDDIKYCEKEIHQARAIFSNPKTTEEQYDAMQKGLGLVYFYCPKEIQTIVQATLTEATMRRTYFEKIWEDKHESNKNS